MNRRPLRCVNLCSGSTTLPGWCNIDCGGNPDIIINLETHLLPFPDNCIDYLACISAINYFTFERGRKIIRDVYRVLRPGGVARFASQDLQVLSAHYLQRNVDFWFEKLTNGKDRFPGETFAEKFNAFFTDFLAHGHGCKVVYDYETLENIFCNCGFEYIEKTTFKQSRLPDIDLLDNRPEQMFFLEAIKLPEFENLNPDAELLLAEEDLTAGKNEQAWQKLLRIAAACPWHAASMTHLVSGCVAAGCPTDALRIIEMHREATGSPSHLEKLEAPLRVQKIQQEQHHYTPQDLTWLDSRENRLLPDTDHIQGCIDWLCTAHDMSHDQGIPSAYYPLQQRWAASYPETTGYIIATLLAWAAYTKNPIWREKAIHLGDWEIAIQAPNGGTGEAYGTFEPFPRSFNTGQVLLGWMALYKHTSEQRFLDAALRAGLWLTGNIDTQGRFVRYVYQGARSYKVRLAWALFALEKLTGETRFGVAARKITAWTMSQAQNSGWFANVSLINPHYPWTHLISYTLVGLAEVLHIAPHDCPMDDIKKMLTRAARGLINAQETRAYRRKPFFPMPAQAGTYNERWESQDTWSCLTGNAQSAFFLYRFAPFVTADLLSPAAEIIDDLKRVHLMDGIKDRNLYGGLAGSWPLGGGYCPHMLPNWAPKFFADTLLLRTFPQASDYYIG